MDSQKIVDFGAVTGIWLGNAAIGRPLMSVYCYYLDGLLIDTSAKNNRCALLEILPQFPVERVALTHYHEDHAGNAAYLHQTFSWPVLAGTKTCAMLAQRHRLRPYEHFMWGDLESMRAQEMGKQLKTNRYSFDVIESPGHSADHIVLHEPEQGWLFSGDMFLGPKIKYFRRDECLYTTIISLNRLLQLEFETLFCGHNPQTKHAKAMLARKRDHLFELYGQVAKRYHAGQALTQILAEMGQGREQVFVKWITLGDVSFANMLRSAFASLTRGDQLHGL